VFLGGRYEAPSRRRIEEVEDRDVQVRTQGNDEQRKFPQPFVFEDVGFLRQGGAGPGKRQNVAAGSDDGCDHFWQDGKATETNWHERGRVLHGLQPQPDRAAVSRAGRNLERSADQAFKRLPADSQGMGKVMAMIGAAVGAAVKIGSSSFPRKKRAGRAGRRCERTLLQEPPSVHWHLGTPLFRFLKTREQS